MIHIDSSLVNDSTLLEGRAYEVVLEHNGHSLASHRLDVKIENSAHG